MYSFLGLFFSVRLVGYAQMICNGRKAMLTEDGVCNPSPYILDFNEEFDGTSLDTSVWISHTGVIRDVKHTIAKQWFTPANIEVSNGTLKLFVKREQLLNQCYTIWDGTTNQSYCEDFDFTAAQVDTRRKFSHGKIEISCKIAKGKGIASSFWTYGDPAMNEIDIFEFETEENVFGKYESKKDAKVHHMNIHTDYDGNSKTEDCPSKYEGPDYSSGFHTFTLIWTEHKIEWYVDGVLKRTSNLFYSINGQPLDCGQLRKGDILIKDNAFPMNPMSIILDNIVQVGSKAPSEDTELPTVFEIDYVRHWRQNP